MAVTTTKYPQPTITPEQLYWIAEAAYEEKPRVYLEKHCSTIEYEKSAKVGGFQIILCKNVETNTYAVAFQGTEGTRHIYTCVRNWVSNVRDFLVRQKDLLKRIGKVVDGWAKKIERERGSYIDVFVGHSRGGDFASHVKPSWQVLRITLNGHHIIKTQAAQRLINLRLADDFLTDKLNHTKYCICIAEGGHSLEGFKDLCRSHTWSDLTTGKVIDREGE